MSKDLKQVRDRSLKKEHSKEKKMQNPKGGSVSILSKEIQESTVRKGGMIREEVRGPGVCV